MIADKLSRTLTIVAGLGMLVSTLFLFSIENAHLTAARQAALVDRAQLSVARIEAVLHSAEALAALAEQAIELESNAAARRRLTEALGQTQIAGLTAYTEDGKLLLEVGASGATASRLQAFATASERNVGRAPNASVALFGLSDAGRVQTLIVNVSRSSEVRQTRGVSLAIPAEVARAWLAPSDALPRAAYLSIGASPEMHTPWVTLPPLDAGDDAPVPRDPLSATALSADRSFSVLLSTSRPSPIEIAASAARLWAIMLGPALALIGAVVLRRRFVWQRLERRFTQTESRAQLQSDALALAKVGLVTWDLDTATVSFSRTWRALLGFSGAEVSDDISEWLDRLHEADRDHSLANYQALLDAGVESFQHDVRLLTRAGSYQRFTESGQRALGSNAIIVTLTRSTMTVSRRRNAKKAEADAQA